MYDAIIIGTGPAGLQASMALSRVRRSHLLISMPEIRRNMAAPEMHTFLTRDGTPPLKFVQEAKKQINGYGFAAFVDGKVVSTEKGDVGFIVKLNDGTNYAGRKLLIASGVKDVFLPVEGIHPRIFGSSSRICGIMGNRHCALYILWRIRTQGPDMRCHWH